MLAFSPDDRYLLTSAVDNEVCQRLAVDGTLHARLRAPRTGEQLFVLGECFCRG